MKYVLAQKNINYCLSRGYEIAEVWTKYYHNNITFVKLVPKEETLEIKHCWQAMGFNNTKREVYVSAFSTSESILGQVGLTNDLQWNEVYERITGNTRNVVTGRWRGKRDIKCATSQWKARDKKVNQKKFKNFDDLYELCSHYHLNYNFISKQFDDGLDVFCSNSGILIKKAS